MVSARVAGTGVQVRETRKATPLLRSLETYAVRCGGGTNHRAGLYDVILIKDNHIATILRRGGARRRIRRLRTRVDRDPVEVNMLKQLDEAVAHGACTYSWTTSSLTNCGRQWPTCAWWRSTVSEVSGGLSLHFAREVASTGGDLLAVGAVTHLAPTLDIGLDD
jgi:nicotinate-nucleotide pyrophosphorylase (carboxylating)